MYVCMYVCMCMCVCICVHSVSIYVYYFCCYFIHTFAAPSRRTRIRCCRSATSTCTRSSPPTRSAPPSTSRGPASSTRRYHFSYGCVCVCVCVSCEFCVMCAQKEIKSVCFRRLHFFIYFYIYLFFAKVIKHDPQNVFAANGIGCVLAMSGKIADAKDVFIKVSPFFSFSFSWFYFDFP